MNIENAVQASGIGHRYGDRTALDDVSFEVKRGEIFGLLGPNGGGKTTLFRILSTSFPPTQGGATILGHDLKTQADEIRRMIGVVFQSPSLDKKLTVLENLLYHGQLYSLTGRKLRERAAEMMRRLMIEDRAGSLVETLSGGLARRVELAKGLLHHPRLLILDEPSVGLDPGARRDLWLYLQKLRDDEGVTILTTTHLIDEADRCDRVLILNQGKVVALDAPDKLKEEIGGDVVTIASRNPEELGASIQRRFGIAPVLLQGKLRYEREIGHAFIAQVIEAFPDAIDAISLSKPTLEDVFIARTGHRFWEGE